MVIENTFLSAIEKLYQAALEPEKWIAFMDEFAKILNSPGGHYYLWDQQANGITFSVPSSAYTDAINRAHAEHWFAYDNLFKRSLERSGEWLLNDREFDKKYRAKDAFHNEYMLAIDVRYVTGYRTTSTTPVSSAIGFARDVGQQPMGDTEMGWLKRLQPHFELAGRLHREMMQLRLSAAMQEQALCALDYPILLVYENGCIAFLNSAAESWLVSNASVTVKFQRLIGRNRVAQERLEQLLRDAHQLRVSGVQAIANNDGGKPYQMMVMPLSPLSRMGSVWHRPLALVVVTDPQAKGSLTEAHMQTLFGLTAAEARVCMGLAEGKTVEEIAQEARVSINTTRTQLKQALNKTGTRRQAELVSIVGVMPRLRNDS